MFIDFQGPSYNNILHSNSSNSNITNEQNALQNSCTTLSITWSKLDINITPTDCDNNPYIGTICRDFLTVRHLCTIEDGDIVIYSNESEKTQAECEKDLLNLNSLLGYTKLIQLCMVSIIIVYSALQRMSTSCYSISLSILLPTL